MMQTTMTRSAEEIRSTSISFLLQIL